MVSSEEFKSQYPRKNPKAEFLIIDGYIDILLPSVSSGAAGVSAWSLSGALYKMLIINQNRQSQVCLILSLYVLPPSPASAISGSTNLPIIFKRTCVRLWELSSSITGTPEYKEAQRLQNQLALVDGFMQKIGVSGNPVCEGSILLTNRVVVCWNEDVAPQEVRV